MSENSQWNVNVPWQEGTEDDFKDLHESLRTKKASYYLNKMTSSNSRKEIGDKNFGQKFSSSDEFSEDEGPGDTTSSQMLWAAKSGDLTEVKSLLSQDLSLANCRDDDEYTPLHRASYSNNHQILKVLLDNGADITSKTSMGWQPLHSAAKWNAVESVLLLLKYGADPNAQSDGGQTPLHIAASNRDALEVIKILLMTPGIDATIRNDQEDAAVEVARRSMPFADIFEALDPAITDPL